MSKRISSIGTIICYSANAQVAYRTVFLLFSVLK